MWTYSQRSGELRHGGTVVATGYSGIDEGKNNPALQAVPNLGPIPQGNWSIVGPPIKTVEHGPYVLRLQPSPETKTFGRAGFLIHGDSIESPGCASHGCIILAREIREKIWISGDRELVVVSELPTQDIPKDLQTTEA